MAANSPAAASAAQQLPSISTFTNVMLLSNLGALRLTYASRLPKVCWASPAINLMGLGITGVLSGSDQMPKKEAARAGMVTSAISLVPAIAGWRANRNAVVFNSLALTGMSLAFFSAKFGTDARE